jgi:D-tyrosyl-tRNA(Tyr) deacylase
VELRVMPDEAGVMNRSIAEAGGEVLVVSQFTLYGDTSGGRRPGWIAAARQAGRAARRAFHR